MNNTKSLIICFNKDDENYFDGKIKNIDKGNTEIIAEYIKDITNSDVFKAKPLVEYSKNIQSVLRKLRKECKIITLQ